MAGRTVIIGISRLSGLAAIGLLGVISCAAQELGVGEVPDRPKTGQDVIKDGRTGPGAPLPSATWTLPAEESTELSEPEPTAFPTVQWRLRHRGAQQVGQPVSYTSFGAFVPRVVDDGLWFLDAQLLLDNNGRIGGNLGLGRRWYDESMNRISGVSLWYDVRNSDADATFHQLGLGLESLGEAWDLRGNVYAPVSDPVVSDGGQVFGPAFFHEQSLVRTVTGFEQAALKGADVEIARHLGVMNAWLYAGAYHFQGHGLQVYGSTGGVRGFVTPNLAAEVAVTNDAVFDTNVVFAFTWFLPGGPRSQTSRGNVYERLIQPAERNYAIAVAETQGPTGLEVLQAPGGTPLRIVHVNSAAPPAGTGTVTNPFHTLAEAQAGSNTDDIVFVHSGSTFVNESVTLQAGQQWLGEGVDHFVLTEQAGLAQLPPANGGQVLPEIGDAPVDAFRTAPNSTVSGFVINSPGGRGIAASNLNGDVRISHVQVNGAVNQGIFVADVQGRAAIDRTAVNNSGNEGILLRVNNLVTTNATVTNNVLTNNGVQDFQAINVGPNNARLRLNLVQNESAQGFRLTSAPGTLFDLGGPLGQGMTFTNSDNGNIAATGNRSNGGAPIVNVFGNITIVDPATILAP